MESIENVPDLRNAPPAWNAAELAVWLDTATRDLCDDPRERVCTEIKSHYDETVRASAALGRTSGEAHREAMAALGDPKTARKALKRAYLTKEEEAYLWLVSSKNARKVLPRPHLTEEEERILPVISLVVSAANGTSLLGFGLEQFVFFSVIFFAVSRHISHGMGSFLIVGLCSLNILSFFCRFVLAPKFTARRLLLLLPFLDLMSFAQSLCCIQISFMVCASFDARVPRFLTLGVPIAAILAVVYVCVEAYCINWRIYRKLEKGRAAGG